MQGVLEFELFPPVCLCPEAIVRTPEYPSVHVFGLHYEHTVAGDDHVIDLRRAPTGPYRYIVDIDVIGRSQKKLLRDDGLEFAEPTPELQRRGHFERYFPRGFPDDWPIRPRPRIVRTRWDKSVIRPPEEPGLDSQMADVERHRSSNLDILQVGQETLVIYLHVPYRRRA